jgi:hypothetical protein
MKFPITREALQAFDIEKDKAEQLNVIIENHVNTVVRDICLTLESSINFLERSPRNYYGSMRESLQKKILTEKRFVWDQLRNILLNVYSQQYIHAEKSVVIELLVQKLKEKFIGCDIIVDPLKTYLIIDWS